MAEPFLSEIRIMGFNFAPRGWAHCDGQVLPINQNQSLYSLLGTTYGGDGRTNFGLPDLRGRTPMHPGINGNTGGHRLGEKSGEEEHQLTVAEMPAHTHPLRASTNAGDRQDPENHSYAASGERIYHPYEAGKQVGMAADAVATTGNNQPHTNMQPFTVVNFCIALQGLFPSRN